MQKPHKIDYVPALSFSWLAPYYDVVVGMTTRERAFKQALIRQAGIEAGQRVLDLGCGTGTLAIWIKQSQPLAEVTGVDGDPAILARSNPANPGRQAIAPQGLQGLKHNQHDDAGGKRHREIIHVQWSEAEEFACHRRQQRQAQDYRNRNKNPQECCIWSTQGC